MVAKPQRNPQAIVGREISGLSSVGMHKAGFLPVAELSFDTNRDVCLAAVSTGEALCDTLTTHLRAVQHDWHLRIVYHPDPQPPRDNAYTDSSWLATYWAKAQIDNYGLHRVERLPGNLGYLELHSIDEAEQTAEAIAAAIGVLANTSALILDLRQNHGGAPSGVAFLCSYFFPPEPIHINSIYSRPGDTLQQYWTLAYVPGKRYLNKPVFVLTSSETFSGGEEIAYDLQALKRATIVGETTRGGANPVDVYQLHPHFDIRVPSHRAINPVTGGNWEGVGVIPDIQVPQAEALRTARLQALNQISAQIEQRSDSASQSLFAEIQEARAVLMADRLD